MRINNNPALNFQKTLKATCSVVKNGKKTPCNIYELDSKEDKNYFAKLFKKNDWKNAFYLDNVESNLVDNLSGFKTYALEDEKNQNCLGYCEIRLINNGYNLDFIEALPKQNFFSRHRKMKYIGETLIAFLCKSAQKSNLNQIYIPYPRKEARDFYIDNCGFEPVTLRGLKLKSKDFDSIIKQNEKHTSKIELMA